MLAKTAHSALDTHRGAHCRLERPVLMLCLLLAACGGGELASDDSTARATKSEAGLYGPAQAECDDDDALGDNMLVARKRLTALSFAVALTACGGGGDDSSGLNPPAPPPPASSPAGPSPALVNEVLVQFKSSLDVDNVSAGLGLTKLEQFGKRPIWRLRVSANVDVANLLTTLRADSRVQAADQNFESETPEGRRKNIWVVGNASSATAASQWSLTSMRLPQAQSLSTGANIRVAVLDTGIDATHPAFAGKLLPGRDFVDDDVDPSEVGPISNVGYGHGTHVVGLVSQAAPGAQIIPVRVLDAQGKSNVWVLVEALGWAVDPDGNPNTDDGAHVINLSLGTTQQTSVLRTAVDLADCDFDDDDDQFSDAGYDDDKARCANKFGAVVLAAAGNDGSETQLQYPAAEQALGLLPIGAHTEANRLADFSNRGSFVKLAAPGDAIISTFPGGGYATWSGTSMATPLTAGAAALVLASIANPRDVLPLDVVKRLSDRSVLLCGTSIRKIDALAAVSDTQGTDPVCN
jgi:subtilisin family serine protease